MPRDVELTRPGGRYTVHDLSAADPRPDAPVVVAVHGITANGLWFAPLARALAGRVGERDVRVLAPCLRGRADSAGVGRPRGLAGHAADVAAVCRAAGSRPVVLVGHSMGAWVAAMTAAGHPAAVHALVLLDGGLSVPLPQAADVDATIRATLGPALRRLGQAFPDSAAYLRYWRSHPALRALGPDRDADLAVAAGHDVEPDGPGPGVRAVLRPGVVLADARDVATDPTAARATRRAVQSGVPVRLLWARRGLLDDPEGAYDEARLARLAPCGLHTRCVPANHLTLLLDEPGLAEVADAVAAVLP